MQLLKIERWALRFVDVTFGLRDLSMFFLCGCPEWMCVHSSDTLAGIILDSQDTSRAALSWMLMISCAHAWLGAILGLLLAILEN